MGRMLRDPPGVGAREASQAGRRAGLLELAERGAARRGYSQIILATHSFQAPEFYRKLGFEVVASIPEYPRGHQHLHLRKRLGLG